MVYSAVLLIVAVWSSLLLSSSGQTQQQANRGGRAVLFKSTDPRQPCRFHGYSYPIQLAETNRLGQVVRVRTVVDQADWARLMAECHRRAAVLSAATAIVVAHQQEAAAVNNPAPGPAAVPPVMAKPVPTSSSSSSSEPGASSVPQAQPQHIIYPGTKWCGPGDIASNYEDLGLRGSTDRCCRDHDHCPDTMAPGTCKHGLCNETPFWKSHCDCDEQFRQCLMRSSDSAGLSVGFIYFDMASVSCYRQNSTQCAAGNRRSDDGSWCFENPRPFKKPAMSARQQISRSGTVVSPPQHHQFVKHVFSTAGDVKTAVISSLAGSKGGK